MPPRLHSNASSRSSRENSDKLKFGQRLRACNVDVRAFTRTDDALSFQGAPRIKCGASSGANHAPAKAGAGTLNQRLRAHRTTMLYASLHRSVRDNRLARELRELCAARSRWLELSIRSMGKSARRREILRQSRSLLSRLNAEALRRLAALQETPHRQVRCFEVTAESIGVEQHRRRSVFREPLAETGQECWVPR